MTIFLALIFIAIVCLTMYVIGWGELILVVLELAARGLFLVMPYYIIRALRKRFHKA